MKEKNAVEAKKTRLKLTVTTRESLRKTWRVVKLRIADIAHGHGAANRDNSVDGPELAYRRQYSMTAWPRSTTSVSQRIRGAARRRRAWCTRCGDVLVQIVALCRRRRGQVEHCFVDKSPSDDRRRLRLYRCCRRRRLNHAHARVTRLWPCSSTVSDWGRVPWSLGLLCLFSRWRQTCRSTLYSAHTRTSHRGLLLITNNLTRTVCSEMRSTCKSRPAFNRKKKYEIVTTVSGVGYARITHD